VDLFRGNRAVAEIVERANAPAEERRQWLTRGNGYGHVLFSIWETTTDGRTSARPLSEGSRIQDPVQMTFAEDDDVVEALSAYGSHKPFSIWILPG
jgi:hypothetical protein